LASADGAGPGPALRLLAARGRLVTGRLAIVAAAASARRGASVYTVWPDARAPIICADVGYPPTAEWLRRTIVPTLRRLPDAAAWLALRAGGALVPERPGLASRAATEAVDLGAAPRVALYSPSGQAVSKAISFVFAQGESEPRAVVKAMADPRFSARLRRETEALDAVRRRVAQVPAVWNALPPAALSAGELDGEFVTVERLDRLALATGAAARKPALAWLRAFQDASSDGRQPWTADEAGRATAAVQDAWRLAPAPSAADVADRVGALLGAMVGAPMPRCAVHGDFWRGNIAAVGDDLRVADWEWAASDGTPLFDLWTYELAELRWRAAKGERELEPALSAALGRVCDGLAERSLDSRWAMAMLAPVLAELSFRIRRRIGVPDGMEAPSMVVMRAAERLLRT
jgi:hypothetical protein